MKVQIRRLTARLKAGFHSSHGVVRDRELLLLGLEDHEGRTGWGESAPLESYDGVRAQDVRSALEDCRGLLDGSDGRERSELLAACADVAVLPQAVAAVDLALWDLAGRQARQPVWRLLGADSPAPIEVNHTLTATDRAGAATEALLARRAGFRCLKAKVAIGDDAGRLAAVRAATGPDMAVRLDANGAWSVPEADGALRSLQPLGVELCEEPVSGPGATRTLAELTPVPLALDESAAAPGALDVRACTAVCLKVGRWGGITGVLQAAARARAAGYEIYLASTLDGPLGIAAALHAAAAIAPDRPSGLATLSMFEREDPLPPVKGKIAVPGQPGLGSGLRAWYAEASE